MFLLKCDCISKFTTVLSFSLTKICTGMKIDNEAKRGMGVWPFDLRYYFFLKGDGDSLAEKFKMEAKKCGVELDRYLVRMGLFLVNEFDLSEQICMGEFPTSFATTVGTPPIDERKDRHLFFYDDAIIFGGHPPSDKIDKEATDQLHHHDIQSVVVGDHGDCSVTKNPNLRGLFKPGSFVAPLLKSRQLFFMDGCDEKIKVTIFRGQVVFFQGDKTHGGVTFPWGDDPSDPWHPSVHVHLGSLHHQPDKLEFDVDLLALATTAPHALPWLKAEAQREACEPLCKRTEAALTATTHTPATNLAKRHFLILAGMLKDKLNEGELEELTEKVTKKLKK